jgi:hypothetical protein
VSIERSFGVLETLDAEMFHQGNHRSGLLRGFYLRELLIALNLVLSLPPIPFTTAMIASAMPAAIRPYSIAVAPDSSAANLRMAFIIGPD